MNEWMVRKSNSVDSTEFLPFLLYTFLKCKVQKASNFSHRCFFCEIILQWWIVNAMSRLNIVELDVLKLKTTSKSTRCNGVAFSVKLSFNVFHFSID